MRIVGENCKSELQVRIAGEALRRRMASFVQRDWQVVLAQLATVLPIYYLDAGNEQPANTRTLRGSAKQRSI